MPGLVLRVFQLCIIVAQIRRNACTQKGVIANIHSVINTRLSAVVGGWNSTFLTACKVIYFIMSTLHRHTLLHGDHWKNNLTKRSVMTNAPC